MVLHRQTVERLPFLAQFIYRNLPFVEHVAFMGLEPMGYARGNRDLLWIDPLDYAQELKAAVRFLHDRDINTSIYNVPLCALEPNLWLFARQSISDWKNSFAAPCETCAVKDKCCGFFRSAGPDWQTRGLRPLTREAVA